MKGWIYLLHFDTKMSHAEHYLGSTYALRARLETHANGHGSRICRALHQNGCEWTLAALYQTTLKNLRKIERKFKDQHNTPRFCPICNPTTHSKIAGATSYDVSLITFPAHSKLLRTNPINVIGVRPATIDDCPRILEIMKQHNDALGFIPIGGEQGFTHAIERQRVIVATKNGEIVGYVLITETETTTTIQQVAVDIKHQLEGFGRLMIDEVESLHPERLHQCNVRDDLPALGFWESIGYNTTHKKIHATSGSTLHHFEKESRP